MPTSGDLPDWQSLESPGFQNISVFDPGPNTSTPLISQSTPFRIWAVWITAVVATNAAYAGTGFSASARILEANNAMLLAVTLNPAKASDHAEGSMSLEMNGYVTALSLTTYSLTFKVDSVPTGGFIHASCGVILSSP